MFLKLTVKNNIKKKRFSKSKGKFEVLRHKYCKRYLWKRWGWSLWMTSRWWEKLPLSQVLKHLIKVGSEMLNNWHEHRLKKYCLVSRRLFKIVPVILWNLPKKIATSSNNFFECLKSQIYFWNFYLFIKSMKLGYIARIFRFRLNNRIRDFEKTFIAMTKILKTVRVQKM